MDAKLINIDLFGEAHKLFLMFKEESITTEDFERTVETKYGSSFFINGKDISIDLKITERTRKPLKKG